MNQVLRVACYERVSTEEQAKHGLSVASQIHSLEQWVNDQGHILVGHYTDEGVSGGKPVKQRPAMLRLLHDIEKDKVDLVIFTKLDRWFRSVQYYYSVQEILDQHHVAWSAINEDYETMTASGKFKVNIMLAVAENERQRTAERIRDVFKYKEQQGLWLSGTAPFGYTVQDGHLVKDPATEEACAAFWKLLIAGKQINESAQYLAENYHIYKDRSTWTVMTHNPIYTGMWHGKPDHFPKYIEPDVWSKLEERAQSRKRKHDICYLFNRLVKCPDCGKTMNAAQIQIYYYYRCPFTGTCNFRKSINEEYIEKELIETLIPAVKTHVRAVEESKTNNNPAKRKEALEAKLKRLGKAYVDGVISEEDYESQVQSIKKELQQLQYQPEETDLEDLKALLESDLQTIYASFTREEKSRFWHSLIRRIHLNLEGHVSQIIF